MKIKPCQVKLSRFSGEQIPVKGQVRLKCNEIGRRQSIQELTFSGNLMETGSSVLLGLDAIRKGDFHSGCSENGDCGW